MRLTKPQQISLLRKWRQDTQGLTFLGFRRQVVPTFCCDNAVVVRWCNMWLAIETDGYTHS
jgi:hypothetical protein